LQRAAKIPLSIMTDEEGGTVQRIANLVGNLPSAKAMAAMPNAPDWIGKHAGPVARNMSSIGVNMNLAPVLDLDPGTGPPNNVDADGERSFSTDPNKAFADGWAFALAMGQNGVTPVIKHFPGLGETVGNTDVTAAHTKSIAELRRAGLLPFKWAIEK